MLLKSMPFNLLFLIFLAPAFATQLEKLQCLHETVGHPYPTAFEYYCAAYANEAIYENKKACLDYKRLPSSSEPCPLKKYGAYRAWSKEGYLKEKGNYELGPYLVEGVFDSVKDGKWEYQDSANGKIRTEFYVEGRLISQEDREEGEKLKAIAGKEIVLPEDFRAFPIMDGNILVSSLECGVLNEKKLPAFVETPTQVKWDQKTQDAFLGLRRESKVIVVDRFGKSSEAAPEKLVCMEGFCGQHYVAIGLKVKKSGEYHFAFFGDGKPRIFKLVSPFHKGLPQPFSDESYVREAAGNETISIGIQKTEKDLNQFTVKKRGGFEYQYGGPSQSLSGGGQPCD